MVAGDRAASSRPGLGMLGIAARVAVCVMLSTAMIAEVSAQSDVKPKSPAAGATIASNAATPTVSPEIAEAARSKRIGAVRSWGYQLNGLTPEFAAQSPYDLLVVDATAGLGADLGFTAAEVARLKTKPDGTRRLVVSYLSIGEAEEYRPDYYSREYMEEDAPDWLLSENPKWKGNRLVRFCTEGWQRTIIGDDTGRSLYNSLEASPLHRLLELGFDGVYIDRVDVYAEVAKECPDGRTKMIQFIERMARSARASSPEFLVILQNAEELLTDARVVRTIDAVAKEDLFYGADHTEAANPAKTVTASIGFLKRAKAAGRAVFVVDYVRDKTKSADVKARAAANGFIPYIAPRDLGALWLAGVDY